MAQPQPQQGLPGQAHPMQRPMMMPPQPDPVVQARIDADFNPVNLAVGGPGRAFAFCDKHKVEKCDECNLDFTSINKISKIFITNPNLRCPPPPAVIQSKITFIATKTKEDGNNMYKLGRYREAAANYTGAAAVSYQRPPWESSAMFREEFSAIISNRSTAMFEAGDYIGALTDAETVIAIRRNWPKGHFRKAKALVALGHLDEAIESVSLGLQFEPNNAELNGYMAELQKLADSPGAVTSSATPSVTPSE